MRFDRQIDRQEAANNRFSQFSDALKNKQEKHNILNVRQVNGVEYANTSLEMLFILTYRR
jgi:hypothetical protein